MLDGDDFAFERHRRFQAVVLGRPAAGRAAVQHDARAHPVGRQCGIHQDGARVRQAQFTGQSGGLVAEPAHLLGHRQESAAFDLAIGKMGHELDAAHRRHRAQPLVGLAPDSRLEAEPVHAGIHLQMHVQRSVQPFPFQHRQLLGAMYGQLKTVFGDSADVLRVKESFQQDNRFGPARFAQFDRIFDFDQRQPVSRGKGFRGAMQAMAVGIGLDDAPGFGSGDSGTDDLQVVLQCSGIDDGNEGSRHDGLATWLRESARQYAILPDATGGIGAIRGIFCPVLPTKPGAPAPAGHAFVV